MAGNTFGVVLRMSTAGESHGAGQVVIIDGVPAGLALSVDDLKPDLARRRPGQSAIVSPRRESDEPEIISGVFEGLTTGTPIAISIPNLDSRPKDYAPVKDVFRPGHADYGYTAKYGRRDYRGGGRSSARETAARVAAGAVAKKVLAHGCGARVVGFVAQVGHVVAQIDDPSAVTLEQVEFRPDGAPNPTRCPDLVAADAMVELIEQVRADGDSIGGQATVVASGVPVGLGEPVFDKLKADLGKALFSLPAVVGVAYGAGFSAVTMRGSVHNDAFEMSDGQVRTRSNHHGGILGGISTGMPIVMHAAVKPTSSIRQTQTTVTEDGDPTTVAVTGRHDPCLLPRFVPMAEAMVAWVLADHWLRSLAANYRFGISRGD